VEVSTCACKLNDNQHSTAQHSTAQHSTAQHSTAQHSTAQHARTHTTPPPHAGLLLHGRLSVLLECLVLGSNAHLLFALQPDPLLSVFDWGCWGRLMRSMSPQQR
jgi:hypothetical protein